MVSFRMCSRLVALLLVFEGAAGVAYGLWLTASFASLSEVAEWLEVKRPVWAATAGAQIALTIVLPSAALAIGGRRLWRTPEAFDGSRRQALYAVLVVHLAVLVLATLAGAPLWIITGGLGLVVSFAALATGVRTGVEEPAPPGPPVRGWRWVGAAAATVALLASGAAVGAVISDEGDEGPFDLLTYPADAIVCRGAVTEACARRVAARAGRPVAWVPASDGREGRVFVVLARNATPPIGEGRVVQELRDGWVHLSVHTHPAPPIFGGRQASGHVTEGGVTAAVYVDDGSAANADLEWTYDGVAYRISAFRTSQDDQSVIDSARRALAQVRYSSP